MWSFFPPNLLAQALNMFKDASSQPEGVGISWDRQANCPPDGSDCVMTIVSTLFKSQYLNINLHQHSFPFIFYHFSTIYIFVLFLWVKLFIKVQMSFLIFFQDGIYKWLASTFFLWFVLAIYFDNIIPNASGLRKPLFYFLNPSYWTGKGENKVKGKFLIYMWPLLFLVSWYQR